MSNKQFFNNLSSTYTDVRRLDAKKINLKGKNILEYIKDATPTIKHAQDTRETVTENDLWGQRVETLEDGTVIVHDDEVTNPNASSSKAWNTSITKVEDNKAYVGDTLYGNIQTEKIKSGNYMFYKCDNLTSFSSDLSSLKDGTYMFYNCDNLTSFNADLPNMTNGYGMFWGCTNLASISSDSSGSPMNLSNLTNGWALFSYCENLTSFNADLSSLTMGYGVFYRCSKLTSFNSDLPSLTYGAVMFRECSSLTSFNADLPSLTISNAMFYYCDNLTSFSSDLPSLTDGESMFLNCKNLISFNGDLSSLTYGGMMFYSCKLDAQSVMYIIHSIKDIAAEKLLYTNGTIPYVTYDSTSKKYSAPRGFMSDGKYVYAFNIPQPATATISASNVGKLTLGINVTNDSSTIQQQLQTFAEEAHFDSWEELKQTFVDKGWTVTFQYGGTTTDITLSEDEQFRGVPVYARLIEVTPEGEEYTEEEKESAEYCTEDGTKYYNIDWGHDVTDYDQYQYFGSLLEACGYYGVIPKKYLEDV